MFAVLTIPNRHCRVNHLDGRELRVRAVVEGPAFKALKHVGGLAGLGQVADVRQGAQRKDGAQVQVLQVVCERETVSVTMPTDKGRGAIGELTKVVELQRDPLRR